MSDPAIAVSGSDQAEIAAILLEQAERIFTRYVTAACLQAADEGRFPSDAWEAVLSAGLTLALVPEASGGGGVDGAVAGQLIRRSAYHAIPAPFADTLMAQALWTMAGGEPFEGSAGLVAEPAIRLGGKSRGRAVSGEVRQAAWGADVDHLLLLTSVDGSDCLVLLPRADRVAVSRRNVANEPRVSFTLEDEPIADTAIRPLPGNLACRHGLGVFGAFVRAQQMTGAMERCLDLALVYANERKQFGKPIGRFQAVQHMLAEAAGQWAAAAAAAELAAAAFGNEAFPLAAAVAKARCGEAAGKVAEVCHQVHGAMGFTHEHALHFFTRRLWAWRDEFGREAFWQERIGRIVCEQGGEALWPRLVALREAGL
ncbi:MAG: acyl-CoA dehydrogenase [Bradyrhizobiaceae bacterium]|nr:acyl-CoA dehydrogenase [Bradyrhizobiaceae bacterium]